MISWIPASLLPTVSFLLGLLDYGFLLLKILGPLQPKFFRKGYGNIQQIKDCQSKILESLKKRGRFKLAPENIVWGAVQKGSSGITIQEGSFQSPLANEVPLEAFDSQFLLVQAHNGFRTNGRNKQKQVYILMLPATGETDPFIRLWKARQLAKQYGWSSVILTAPFYGKRKPRSQQLFFIDTVRDILAQALAIISEAVMLSSYFLEQDPNAVVCFTGFSFGAAMAGNAANYALKAGVDGERLCCAAYVGSASPCVLADGVLESAIDWKALRQSPQDPQAKTRKELFEVLYETQMDADFKNDYDSRNNKIHNVMAVVKGYSMDHDAFILPQYGREFEIQIKKHLNGSFQMIWLPGGHACAALIRPYLHKRLIVETVNELLKSSKKV